MFDDFGTGGAGAGVSTAVPPTAPGSGVPGSPPDGSAAGSPPAGSVIDWNSAPQQLRDAFQRTQADYQQTKQQLEPWQRLGAKPEDVSHSHQTYQKLYTEATTLGAQVGLDAAIVLQYFRDDPAGTIAELRQAVQQRQPQSDQPITRAEAERLAEQKARSLLRPFEQERELRLDKEAETKFDGEFGQQFKTKFPNGLPDSNREAIEGLAWQLLIDNKEGYDALRARGDVTAINGAMEQATKVFLKIVADYAEHEKKRMGNGQPGPPNGRTPNERKPRTFAEIAAALNDDSVPIDTALGR